MEGERGGGGEREIKKKKKKESVFWSYFSLFARLVEIEFQSLN